MKRNTENFMTPSIVFIIVIASIIGACLSVYIKNLRTENRQLKRSVDYYSVNFLRKQGSTSLMPNLKQGEFLNYELRSFDGGKNWYAVQSDFKTETVKILGEAETVYPGLMKHLNAMDALTAYVEKNGPISLSSENDAVDLLRNIGLTVTNTAQ